MQTMTSRERILAMFDRKPVDQLPVFDSLWGDTYKRYEKEGHFKDYSFGLDVDLAMGGWPNSVANLDFENKVLEETEETVLSLDGNGARLRRHKQHDTTPEHVGFTVVDQETWEEHARPFIAAPLDLRRVPYETYRKARESALKHKQFFCWGGVGPFEMMHPVCGHENMLVGMALEPEWIEDMVDLYCTMLINILEELFSKEGAPDACWFFEDMGFKEKPFMSPTMYRELIMPGHKRLFDFAKSKGCKVIVHSCGYVEALVGGLVEAGMDCLQAMEVKAGMDIRSLHDAFGKDIIFMGNIDARLLEANDLPALQAEMDVKIPYVLEKGGGYILHSDHSISERVDFETLQFFFKHGREMARHMPGWKA